MLVGLVFLYFIDNSGPGDFWKLCVGRGVLQISTCWYRKTRSNLYAILWFWGIPGRLGVDIIYVVEGLCGGYLGIWVRLRGLRLRILIGWCCVRYLL